jgi:hypothetical protein
MRRSARRVMILALLGGLALAPAVAGRPEPAADESGTLSVFFLGEKVGYEDYAWTGDASGYVLRASGRLTKPLALEMRSLTLRLSRDFIPLEYSFEGSLNGVAQNVTSVIRDGHVQNTIVVGGQNISADVEIRRDALILPNPVFSPYLVLAKKYDCGLKDKAEISAYMIPQVEIAGTLEASPADACALTLNLSGVEIVLQTDADRRLVSVTIPSQNLKVTNDRSDHRPSTMAGADHPARRS